ncbi:MAG: alpha-amylase family glycosyl hydrolase [Prevotella sp.]|nr:alpha-amylase family glycosyl hydrolase [Prevotella sp.]MCI7249823.1 alpha-amylase family glycosyl hydrolase [Prevotella sp.]MDY3283872.1 alpha-amylase family glycosyl hydrolase [Prevotella sp.]MDY5926978.1 alpha-amylase family glycosyl hydrolase [Prevotella sp.]MEE1206179.1 alpha-amylase family glycosyl hydrolase [Prevotella sp.]
MKKILTALLLGGTLAMNAAQKIDRIEPTNWYVGMKNPSVQLMVYGKDIRSAEVSTNYPGVKIDSLVRLDSPNYLLVYMNIKDAQPGTMKLCFKTGKNKTNVNYELKARDMKGEDRQGFTNADVLYMLMPDRFASSGKNLEVKGLNAYKVDRSQPSLRHGGDLEGLRQHLDYFTELGVTALWFTPVLENNSPDHGKTSTYHGYATTDYYRVDPRFGSNADYRRLVDEAHKKGLKVVMDMIFNHCGFEHPWVKDMPTKDWFNTPEWLYPENQKYTVKTQTMDGEQTTNTKYLQTSYKLTPVLDPYASKVDLHETVDGWFVPTMPDLNQRNEHLMTYLIQNSEWWIETVGIDGIRMDTYPYADRKGMARWMEVLNEEYPNFNTVGETWVTEPAYTAAWQKDSPLQKENSNLKTVMDFAFFDRVNQAKNEETDAWWNGFNRIYNSLCYDYLYKDPSHVMAFIENHDTDRFLGETQDTLALKQALALLLTVNRIPQLYYGTEVLMNGTKQVTDGNVRKDFPGGFPGDTRSAFTTEGRTKAENDMFRWTARLLHWRQGNEVITKGKQTQFIPQNGVYVVARSYNGKNVMTVINGTSKAATMKAERYAEIIGDAQEATNILTGHKINISKDVKLAPRGVMVLEF